MGNWRTVNITGTIHASEIPKVRAYVDISDEWLEPGFDFSRQHCLSYAGPSLCGLNEWYRGSREYAPNDPERTTPLIRIDAQGNLSERDYSVEDVAEALRGLVVVAPSADLRVHCGGDWEDTRCVATITVADGVVTVGEPLVEVVQPVGEAQMAANLARALLR